ncbi:flagellar hook-associated protein FlgK [Undibacterium piscinae]|uniref:Flagellar hook-associated protein 1 n=1 Tax=Undibacterium piscinae TaxID=2495591 RepID=A0A6M4A1Q8_9BURK|nr:flagellar hook-associated protein FlgK [Undibacterium piscinae]
MGTNILGIGQSALLAAQMGIATTGHNIANASSLGYNRQVLLQSAAEAQNVGGAFVGQGVRAGEIKRIYNEFVAQQVNSTQSSKNYANTYLNQISQIDNLVADPKAGASPAMQEFFNAIQNLATTPNGTAGAAARQSVISSGAALTSRLQSLQGRLDQLREGVNGQIEDVVGSINSYAGQLAELNHNIELAESVGGTPNDLLDHRDSLVTELSKLVNISVVPQGSKFNVYMGTGQPLVLGAKAYNLQAVGSLTDPTRMEVAYETNGALVQLAENTISSGKLGGLFAFRANSLDVSQNSLGRVAIAVGTTFNEQHKLGQDLNGALGTDFFSVGAPTSLPSSANNAATGNMSASIVDVGALTTSDYRVQYLAGNYKITRLSDGALPTPALSPTLPIVFDGVSFNPPAVTPTNGDEFLIRPTASGASSFGVVISDTSKIAAAAPIATNYPSTNTGSGKISAGAIDATFTPATFVPPVAMTFAANAFTGFPAGSNVSVTSNGVTTSYAPYVAGTPVTYTSGATISVGGANVVVTGTPAAGDVFTISPNTSGSGDNRNALLLGKLQTKNTLIGNTTSFQGAYAQFVSLVGNKSHELAVVDASETILLKQAVAVQQSSSGVNLDEEAANLLRYQQAYQAAGKLMQIASQLFDSLLALGR